MLRRLPFNTVQSSHCGNIGISFTPREVGEHAVSVKRQGKHIHNSPFKVNFDELEALIGRTSKRALANYAIWRIVLASIPYMPSRFRSREQEYSKLTLGRETTDPRWLECVRQITSSYQI
ncbi:hypothetical protein HA402_013812 [Bradysia odoriphaga]|nr:hypothetical protein HA402_013812 [Bradysia odoriphaga]